MHTFTDSASPPRDWTITLEIDAAKRVRDLLQVDLLNPGKGDPPLHVQLELDDALLVDVVFALVQPQALQREVTDSQFGQALGGDAISRLAAAFWGEWILFFRQRGRLETVTVLQKHRELMAMQGKLAAEKAESIDVPETARRILAHALMTATAGISSTGSPELLAFNPEPGPSES